MTIGVPHESMVDEALFVLHHLDEQDVVFVGQLPQALVEREEFDALWRLHPAEYPIHQVYGRMTRLPRWQQAYGRNYHFSGVTSIAAAIPSKLFPLLDWSQAHLDRRLNGLLLNWYDGSIGHYIGKHRDSRKGLVVNAPIVTISFGETRIFRLRRWKGKESVDFPVRHGSVLVVPYRTNLAWTHEITKSKSATGRRISVTLRAFE